MEKTQSEQLGIADIIGTHRDNILRIARQYGADNVRVFGSVARGEARPDSDLDLLADFREGATIFDMVGLWLDLKDLLGREVDISTEKSLKRWIKPNALKDAVPL